VKSSASSFEDGYLNLSHRLSEHSNMSIQYYGSNDYFRFAKQFAYKWTNSIITTRVNFATHRKASPTVSLSYGSYRTTLVNLSGLNASEIENTMKYAQIKTFVNYVPNEKHTIATGIEMVGYLPTPEKRSPHENSFATAKKVDKTRGVELALFVNDEYQINDFLAISAGLRFVSYHHIGKDTIFNYGDGLPYRTESITDTTIINSIGSIKHYPGLEPRFSARISLSSKESIKISYNRMRQNIHLISNSAAPTPIDLWQVSTKYIPPQISDNFSVGYSRNMKDNLWETSVEGFYKKVQNLVEYRDFPDLYLNPHIETELLSGKGEAYGVELYIRRLKGRWTGWASYTYARSFVRVDSEFEQDEINKGKLFPSNYDKPHSFNLVLDRHIGKKGGYAMVATYNTGRPFTAVETSYIVNGTTVPVYSDRNKYRIPSYLRFDFSVTFGNVFKKWDDSLIFSIYNLFGRDNPYSVFYQRPSSNFFIPKAYKLSIMGAALPSVTYTFKF
jgi:hypothetical protein